VCTIALALSFAPSILIKGVSVFTQSAYSKASIGIKNMQLMILSLKKIKLAK
jgi:hypothetical protein